MYYCFSESDLRTLGKKAIENFERWARRLINERFIEIYGRNWMEARNSTEFIIRKDIRCKRDGSPKVIDDLYIEDIIYFLCTDKFYSAIFKEVLDYSYPQGKEEVREFINRIVPIRNKLAHARPVSVREIEKVVCYTNDFIDAVKEHYKSKGKEKMYNVPTIVRILDSLGNEFMNSNIFRNSTGRGSCVFLSNKESNNCIRVGDTLTIEAEIDPSFEDENYEVSWLCNNKHYLGNKLSIDLDESCVKIDFTIYAKVVSKDHSWHRCGDVDDCVSIIYSVLPPT